MNEKKLIFKIIHRLREARQRRDEAFDSGTMGKFQYQRGKIEAYRTCITMMNELNKNGEPND